MNHDRYNRAGESYSLTPEEILQLRRPEARIRGTYSVVHVAADRCVIIALHWDGRPSLGLRWFLGLSGFPRKGRWLILPDELVPAVLAALDLPNDYRAQLSAFLFGEQDDGTLPLEPPPD